MCNVYLGGEKGIDKVLRNTISISYERSVWVFWLSFVESRRVRSLFTIRYLRTLSSEKFPLVFSHEYKHL